MIGLEPTLAVWKTAILPLNYTHLLTYFFVKELTNKLLSLLIVHPPPTLLQHYGQSDSNPTLTEDRYSTN